MTSQHKPSRIQLASSARALYLDLSPTSPMAKMSQPARSISQESVDGIRKRVCKACDRCRMKKSKCDGSSPCTRCKADNAVCVFGERKKSHDKVYPKGYVEMLEQQQNQLVSALQETYSKLIKVDAWVGPPLAETNGHPLTHDILAALNLIESKPDGSGEEVFEDDCHILQSKLISRGAGLVHRRGSMSSDSEHSQHDRAPSQLSPAMTKDKVFRDSFSLDSAVSPPSKRASLQTKRPKSITPDSPLSVTPPQQPAKLNGDPMLFNKKWPDISDPVNVMRSQYALGAPMIAPGLNDFDGMYDAPMFGSPAMDYDATSSYGSVPMNYLPPQGFDQFATGAQNEFGAGGDRMQVDFDFIDPQYVTV